MNQLLSSHWHPLSIEEVEDLLDSNVHQGLDLFEIKQRQERFGLNEFTPEKGKNPLMRYSSSSTTRL